MEPTSLFIPSKLSKLTLELVTQMNELVTEVNETDAIINSATKHITELTELRAKYSKLLSDYENTLQAYEQFKLESSSAASSSSTVACSCEVFDPAIHNHKPKRPITNEVRLKILDAYQNVYKVDLDVKTLPEFFKYVRDCIYYAISNSEIEGVIYNRFDRRLYL